MGGLDWTGKNIENIVDSCSMNTCVAWARNVAMLENSKEADGPTGTQPAACVCVCE